MIKFCICDCMFCVMLCGMWCTGEFVEGMRCCCCAVLLYVFLCRYGVELFCEVLHGCCERGGMRSGGGVRLCWFDRVV